MAKLMQFPVRPLLLVALLSLLLSHAWAAKPTSKRRAGAGVHADAVSASYAQRDDAMGFADALAERRGLERDWVRHAIGNARRLSQVERWILPATSPTAKNWRVYRSRFIDPVRIQAGVAFWNANQAELERAQSSFGVPAEVIVGIIGVETIYGRNTGNFRVIDALATLSFDFPDAHPRAEARRAFFQGELEQLLSLAQRGDIDPLSLRGSYAGAMGMPQFMPSSWVKYAIDFDADGKIDLFNSPSDVIGSIANYFVAFGWTKGMPTHYPVRFDQTRLDLATLLEPDILPTFSVADMIDKGVVLEGAALQHAGPLALVELHNGEGEPSYVAGTGNFYTVTRYNWSSYYALSVIELGQEIAAARKR